MKELEVKVCGMEIQLKDLDSKKGIVSFYFAPFESKDAQGDTTMPTAFDKTFRECMGRIKHFRNHEEKEVPGVVLELGKDIKGAFAVSKLAMKTVVGNDTFEQYDAGIITEHSYGAISVKSDPDPKGGRILKERALWEVSSLTAWGASQLTPVISLKSLSQAHDYLANLNALLTKGNISDSLGEKFTAEYKKLEEFMKKNAILSAMGKVHCDNCNNILPDKKDESGYVNCPSCGRFANSSTGKTVSLPLFSKSLVDNFNLSK